MKKSSFTEKQLAAAGFTALLSPLLRAIPRIPAALGGRCAWLGPLAAVPALFLLACIVTDLRRSLEPGEGITDLIRRIAGPWAGRALLLLFAGWFLLYDGFLLRSGAERLAAAVYQKSRPEPFMLVMLLLCLTASLGTVRAAVRTAAVLLPVLLAALAAVLALAAPGLSPERPLPSSAADLTGALRSAGPMAAVGSAGAVTVFLAGQGPAPEGALRRLAPLLLLYGGICSLLCFWTVGVFGSRLTARLNYPFFTMVRDVTLFSIAQRIEAVVIVLWISADFAMGTFLLRAAHEALRGILDLPSPEGPPMASLRRGRFLLWLEAAAVFTLGEYLAGTPRRFVLWSDTLAPLCMTAVIYGVFTAVWAVGKIRKTL